MSSGLRQGIGLRPAEDWVTSSGLRQGTQTSPRSVNKGFWEPPPRPISFLYNSNFIVVLHCDRLPRSFRIFGTQKCVHRNWPKSIFPVVNLVFPPTLKVLVRAMGGGGTSTPKKKSNSGLGVGLGGLARHGIPPPPCWSPRSPQRRTPPGARLLVVSSEDSTRVRRTGGNGRLRRILHLQEIASSLETPCPFCARNCGDHNLPHFVVGIAKYKRQAPFPVRKLCRKLQTAGPPYPPSQWKTIVVDGHGCWSAGVRN